MLWLTKVTSRFRPTSIVVQTIAQIAGAPRTNLLLIGRLLWELLTSIPEVDPCLAAKIMEVKVSRQLPYTYVLTSWIQSSISRGLDFCLSTGPVNKFHLIFWVDNFNWFSKNFFSKSQKIKKKGQFVFQSFNFGRTNWPSFF